MTRILTILGATWHTLVAIAAIVLAAHFVVACQDRRRRNRARAIATHPCTRNLTPAEFDAARLVVFPRPTLAGLTEAELIAAVRARHLVAASGFDQIETADELIGKWGQR